MLEAAEIEVCGAEGEEVVVDEEDFCVEHSGLVEEDFDACEEAFFDVALGGVGGEGGVGVAREHYADVDAGEGGALEGFEEGVAREEIGGLEPYAALGAGDGFEEKERSVAPAVGWAGGDDLHHDVGGGVGEVLGDGGDGVGEESVAHELPVDGEVVLQGGDGGAGESYGGVAPMAEASA